MVTVSQPSTPQTQPPASQAPDDGGADAAAIATLAGVLAGGLGTAATVGLVGSVLATAGIASVVGTTNVAAEALRLASLAKVPEVGTRAGPAARSAAQSAWRYRASYVLSAARRLAQGALGEGDFSKALGQERLYAAAHADASTRRIAAARTIDHLAGIHGPVLGWYARRDAKTTPECRLASGGNFSALNPPSIGWPGAVHARCRCYAGRPHPGAGTVDNALRGISGAAMPVTLSRAT
jgi:hypothetical protein